MVPIHDRVVPTHLHSVGAHRFGELLHDVALEWRGHHVVLTHGAVPKCKAVVVLGGDDYILHTGITGEICPLLGIKLHRIELRHKRLLIDDRINLSILQEPFTNATNFLSVPRARRRGVQTKVDEHSKARRSPPRHACIARIRRFFQSRRRDIDGIRGGEHGTKDDGGRSRGDRCAHVRRIG